MFRMFNIDDIMNSDNEVDFNECAKDQKVFHISADVLAAKIELETTTEELLYAVIDKLSKVDKTLKSKLISRLQESKIDKPLTTTMEK